MTSLSHIKVLDLSSHLAGPYCGMVLADHGADVVKVENPKGGDVLRQTPPFQEGENSSLLDIIEDSESDEPEAQIMMESMSEEVASALETLSDRERTVLEMYFGIDRDSAMTLNEIGEEFDLTRERVRQIKEKAIQRLRHRSRAKSLRRYLG